MVIALDTRKILRSVLAVPVAALIGLAGCNLVGDSLTGLSIGRAGPSACVKACVEAQTEGVRAEATLHQNAVEACQALPDSEKHDCLAAEAARHAAAMAQIGAGRSECLNNCHRQGSGSAG